MIPNITITPSTVKYEIEPVADERVRVNVSDNNFCMFVNPAPLPTNITETYGNVQTGTLTSKSYSHFQYDNELSGIYMYDGPRSKFGAGPDYTYDNIVVTDPVVKDIVLDTQLIQYDIYTGDRLDSQQHAITQYQVMQNVLEKRTSLSSTINLFLDAVKSSLTGSYAPTLLSVYDDNGNVIGEKSRKCTYNKNIGDYVVEDILPLTYYKCGTTNYEVKAPVCKIGYKSLEHTISVMLYDMRAYELLSSNLSSSSQILHFDFPDTINFSNIDLMPSFCLSSGSYADSTLKAVSGHLRVDALPIALDYNANDNIGFVDNYDPDSVEICAYYDGDYSKPASMLTSQGFSRSFDLPIDKQNMLVEIALKIKRKVRMLSIKSYDHNGAFSNVEDDQTIQWVNDVLKTKYSDDDYFHIVKQDDFSVDLQSVRKAICDLSSTDLAIVNVLLHGGTAARYNDGSPFPGEYVAISHLSADESSDAVDEIYFDHQFYEDAKYIKNLVVFCESCFGAGFVQKGLQGFRNRDSLTDNVNELSCSMLAIANDISRSSCFGNYDVYLVKKLFYEDINDITYSQFTEKLNSFHENLRKDVASELLIAYIQTYDLLVMNISEHMHGKMRHIFKTDGVYDKWVYAHQFYMNDLATSNGRQIFVNVSENRSSRTAYMQQHCFYGLINMLAGFGLTIDYLAQSEITKEKRIEAYNLEWCILHRIYSALFYEKKDPDVIFDYLLHENIIICMMVVKLMYDDVFQDDKLLAIFKHRDEIPDECVADYERVIKQLFKILYITVAKMMHIVKSHLDQIMSNSTSYADDVIRVLRWLFVDWPSAGITYGNQKFADAKMFCIPGDQRDKDVIM